MIEKNQKDKKVLKISILGDSISTYEGWNPFGYIVYYTDEAAYENGIMSVEDTWWKQVINSVGGELCVNNSFAGSLVTAIGYSSSCCEERCSSLGEEEQPDVILVYMGTNDRGYRVKIGIDNPDDPQFFYGGYRVMLSRLKRNYPSAKIICATLPTGYKKGDENVPQRKEFLEIVGLYNDVIRRAVSDEGCFLADIAISNERYETLDGLHPTAQGHKTLAKLWIEKLNNLL